MSTQRNWLAVLGLGAMAAIWGYNWVIMKLALQFAGPFAFASLRAIAAGALLFGVVLVLRRPFSPGSFPGVLLLALLQTTGFFGLAIWALVSGGAGKTAVLVYTMPFWLIVLAWPLLGERLHAWQWVAVVFAFAGLLALFHPWQYLPHLFSTLLASLAGLSWALSGVFNKYLQKRVKVDLLSLTAWQLILGGIPLLFISLVVGSKPIVWTPYFIGAVAYNVVLGTAVAWTLWFFALQTLPAGIAGMGTLLTPVVGVLSAWIQLGEVPGHWEMIGVILIFSGLMVLSWTEFRYYRRYAPGKGPKIGSGR
jgi:drug/metabolite transporter (DMT)-like permease